jgi:hypothetical protein
MKKLIAFAFVLALTSTLAFAGSGWHMVGAFDAGGEAKEMGVNRNCSVCLVKVTEGSVIINTVVVREGGKKTPHTVGQRIEKGDHREIDIGSKIYATGFRISDDGRGHYEVYVK